MATVNLVSVCLGDSMSQSMRIGRGSSIGSQSTALGVDAHAGDFATVVGQGASTCDSVASTVVGRGAIAHGTSSLVLQSGVDPCAETTPRSRIKICGDNISFRINGVCKSMTGSAFFAALGLS